MTLKNEAQFSFLYINCEELHGNAVVWILQWHKRKFVFQIEITKKIELLKK